MKQETLIFVFNTQNQILLAMKKRGWGAGKWNGAGGKREPRETIEEACVRELQEETGILLNPGSIRKVGQTHYEFLAWPEKNKTIHIFISKNCDQIPQETEEMLPKWYDIEKIPYEEMWKNDAIWLPRLLAEETIEYKFILDAEGKTITSEKIQ